MDQIIASKLTALFRDSSWRHPIDQKAFEVFFGNKLGTQMKFGLSSPEELSATLKHIIDNAGSDLFDRSTYFGSPDPIHVRMTIRDRHPETNKEHIRQAFVMVFRDIEEPSYIYWNETPDVGYNGVGLSDFIYMLDKAENDWGKMNFVCAANGRPQLKLVHSRP